MKLSCDVIKDLLLLYEDGICCEESRQLVEEHLKACAKCSALFQNAGRLGKWNPSEEFAPPKEFAPPEKFAPSKELAPPKECHQEAEMQAQEETDFLKQEQKALKRSFRKIKRRWAISLISLLFLLPIGIAAGTMAYHEYRQEGICFSNLDEILLCRKFLLLLQEGNYQEAVEMLDFESKYREIMDAINAVSEEEETYQWFLDWYYHYYGIPDISRLSIEEFVRMQQLDVLEHLAKYKGTIQSFRFEDAYCAPWWNISYRITEELPETGTQQSVNIQLTVHEGMIYQFSASYHDSTNKSDSICVAFCLDWREDYWGAEE